MKFFCFMWIVIMMAFACGAQSDQNFPDIDNLVFYHNGKIYNIEKNMPCYEEAASQIVNILVTSDDTFDMLVGPGQMEEFRREKSWVEIIFKEDINLMVGYVNQKKSLRKIFIVFKKEKPLYIFFGTPDYLDDTNLAAKTDADTSLFELLKACIMAPG